MFATEKTAELKIANEQNVIEILKLKNTCSAVLKLCDERSAETSLSMGFSFYTTNSKNVKIYSYMSLLI